MKLDYRRTFLLGLGFLAVSAIWSIYNVFVPLFLQHKFDLSPRALAFFVTLDNIAALLIQPPIGVWSDKIRTPIGRRMPFILVGAPVAALAFAFIPVAPILPLFVVCTSSLLISMALWRTPIVALVADVTPSPLRSQASGVISFMGGVGAVIAYFGGGAISKFNPAYPFWLGSIVVIVAAAILIVWVREPKAYEAESPVVDESQPGFWESLKTVCRDRSAFLALLSTFFLMVGYTAVEGFFSLYSDNHLGLSGGESSSLLGQLSLVFIVFALPSGNIGAKYGRKVTVLTGIAGMAALLLAIYLIPVSTLTKPLWTPSLESPLHLLGTLSIIGVLLMLTGICWAFIIIHLLPMLSDMTDSSRIGTYTGLYYLVTSMAAIVGPNLNGWIVQLNHKDYNTVMLMAPIALAIAFALMCGVRKGESTTDGSVTL